MKAVNDHKALLKREKEKAAAEAAKAEEEDLGDVEMDEEKVESKGMVNIPTVPPPGPAVAAA
jgi:hypothetical protein